MINEEAKMYIDAAIEKEKNSAIENHGFFNSDHEFWAVLQEEIEELQEEVKSPEISFRMKCAWECIRKDKEVGINEIIWINEMALNVAYEAVQVAAVISKYLTGGIVNDFTKVELEQTHL